MSFVLVHDLRCAVCAHFMMASVPSVASYNEYHDCMSYHVGWHHQAITKSVFSNSRGGEALC